MTVLSFGFKNGIPADADLVFDVRFLPNPYYVENLKQKTGLDPEVQEYVMGYDVAHAFLAKLEDMVEFLLPNYVAEGKNQLVICNRLYRRPSSLRHVGGTALCLLERA